jgi:small-conductance mechanosensitive channel
MIFKSLTALLLLAALATAATPAMAAEERAGESPAAELEAEMTTTAPVELDGNVLFRVRGVSAFPAEQRAARIQDRIEALARDPGFRTEVLRPVEADIGIKIMAGDQLVMGVYDSDARLEGVSRHVLALANIERIRLAIADYRHARRPEILLQGGLYALGATAVLAAVVALVIWLIRRFTALVERRMQRYVQSLEAKSFRIVRAEQIRGTLRSGLRALRILTLLVIALLYLDVVLDQFVWTRALANRLLDVVIGPLTTMGRAIVVHIPNLIFLAILFGVVRFILRLLRLFFNAIARGSITLANFAPEWAWPTYKIARFAMVAFGLIVAYPYIPGSESAAFKGVSLFLGVVFSLGSSSAIANVIAGYLMTYRRAFKVGDRVQVGDMLGDVIELRLQATHLRTLKNEEVVVPNSLLLNSQVVNYSSLAAKQGLILHTTVGIGYETPWRQVEAMLLMAAERTSGLLKEPAPFVLQKSLGDFAVNYELNAYCGDAHAMLPLYTALHRHILDIFNEYGVQIMTPAYRGDPEQPKLVPKAQWYAAPASPGDADVVTARESAS